MIFHKSKQIVSIERKYSNRETRSVAGFDYL